MIAVDAMGGDFAPRSVVQGALKAAKKNIKVGLYGDQVQLFSLLYEYDLQWESLPIQVIHCSQVIGMADQPSIAIIKNADASIVRALSDLHNGTAQAVVSAGNSGAILVGSALIIERITGISRPAIGSFLFNHEHGATFCIDLGANTDCKPEQLVQFAVMGHVYSKMTYHIQMPRIGLLSNGHEPYKGSQLVKSVYGLLKNHQDLNFIGNVEPEALYKGRVDVLVTDGFAGNVLLKTAEATSAACLEWMRIESQKTVRGRLAASLGKVIYEAVSARIDHEKKGGALLLGVRKPVVVAHGCSSAEAIAAAIMFAHKKVKVKFVERFSLQVAELLSKNVYDAMSVFPKKLHSALEFDKSV